MIIGISLRAWAWRDLFYSHAVYGWRMSKSLGGILICILVLLLGWIGNDTVVTTSSMSQQQGGCVWPQDAHWGWMLKDMSRKIISQPVPRFYMTWDSTSSFIRLATAAWEQARLLGLKGLVSNGTVQMSTGTCSSISGQGTNRTQSSVARPYWINYGIPWMEDWKKLQTTMELMHERHRRISCRG